MSDDQTLLGSNVQPAELDFNGTKVALGDVVAHAHTESGLSVEEWNALDDEDRETLIQAVVDASAKAAADAAEAAEKQAAAQAAEQVTEEQVATHEPVSGRVDSTVPENFTSTDVGQDGTSDEQDDRILDAGAVIGGAQADLVLVNLCSRGMTVPEARAFIARTAEEIKADEEKAAVEAAGE